MASTLETVRSFYGSRQFNDAAIVVAPGRQAALAKAYAALPDLEARALPAWGAMANEVRQQQNWLLSHGFTFSTSETDPYDSVADMFADVEENRHIAVFSTAATGGHPLFPDDVNDAFRAVHDVLGHFAAQRGFDRHGEEAAFQRHVSSFSWGAALAMTTETRGQNAGLIATGDFVDEKIAVLPREWRAPSALKPRTCMAKLAATSHARTFAFGGAA